jgi:hypothetical protein
MLKKRTPVGRRERKDRERGLVLAQAAGLLMTPDGVGFGGSFRLFRIFTVLRPGSCQMIAKNIAEPASLAQTILLTHDGSGRGLVFPAITSRYI